MKLSRVLLWLVVFSLPTLAVAQADADHGPAAKKQAPQSEAQKAFEKLKTLAGSWQGKLTTDPPAPEVQGKEARLNMQVASMGNTVVHDMSIEGRPDHPFTMFVVEAERLLLTHYCDADNRPRMAGRISPDGRTLEFEFIDVSGNLRYGHMKRAVFTFIDEDHHIEEWTFVQPGDKATRARFELRRVGNATSGSGN